MNNYLKSWLFRAAHRRDLVWRFKGKSNPISFFLRPVITHAKLRLVLGAVIIMMVAGATMGGESDPAMAAADTGGPEVVILPASEPSLKTVQAIRKPLDKIDVSQRFWALHSGIDLRAPIGTPIWAVMPGTVIQAERTFGGYGNLVVIQHENGYQTWYGHLSRLETKVGDKVDTQTEIGKVGSTGRSTGPHLHIEVRENERPINPGPILGI